MAGLFGLMIAVKLGFAVVVFKVARHSAVNLYKKEKSEVWFVCTITSGLFTN